MTIFLLIRHGANDMLNSGILAGRAKGVHLNAQGREQAAALAGYLAPWPLKAVYSSPLERTVETAEPIAQAQGQTVTIQPAINEVEFGSWTGRRYNDLSGDPRWQDFNAARSSTRIPSGEIGLEVQVRMLSAMEEMRCAHGACMLALVSHGDPIRSVMAHCLGMPLDFIHRFEISPASVSVVDLTYWHAPRILCMNNTGKDLPLQLNR